MAALVDIEKEDINKIDNMFNDALLVDDDLWLDFNDEYSKFKSQETNGVSCQWSKRITNLFKPHISTLFSYEFPERIIILLVNLFSFWIWFILRIKRS